MARLTLMCGVAGSGKSTYARGLEAQGWLRFSIDAGAWDLGYVDAASILASVAVRLRRSQRELIIEALLAGRDVVVDYSFWSRRQRADYRALGESCGATVDTVYCATDEPTLRRRLATRRGLGPDDFTVDDTLLADYLRGFQPPGADEPRMTVVPPPR